MCSRMSKRNLLGNVRPNELLNNPLVLKGVDLSRGVWRFVGLLFENSLLFIKNESPYRKILERKFLCRIRKIVYLRHLKKECLIWQWAYYF